VVIPKDIQELAMLLYKSLLYLPLHYAFIGT